MAKGVSIFLKTDRANKDGLHSVVLSITRNGKQQKIILNESGKKEDWDSTQQQFVIIGGRGENVKKTDDANKKRNTYITIQKDKAEKIIDDFEANKNDWTLNQFKEKFLSKSKQGNFKEYIDNHIQTLKDTGHIGNANCYSRTYDMIAKYDKKINERVFSEIDIRYVKNFDAFLQKRGNKGNTRKYYFKALRAILNKAIQDKEASEHTYPFGKGGFQVAKLEEETEKRYLPNEYLIKLKTTSSNRAVCEYARNLFLFSYYCYGMSFVDMAHLKQKNIEYHNNGKYIVYKREKTKTQRNVKSIKIKLTDEIQSSIDALKAYKHPLNDYLLPIVTIDHQCEKLYTHIKNKSKRHNDYLKYLASELEFNFNLTGYVSRHTMAMQLQSNDIPREIISQVLGHNDLNTTNVYLDSLDSSVIDEATKVL